MLKKKNPNNPYKNFTLEEIANIERNLFVIQVGDDFWTNSDGYAFPKKEAEVFFNEIYKGMIDLLYNGNEKEKKEVLKIFPNFKILELRIH